VAGNGPGGHHRGAQCRPEVVAVLQFRGDRRALAADEHLGALVAADLDVGGDLVELLHRDLRAGLRLGVEPYVGLAVFAVGHVWRYRYDKFGWTTRSSQLYEHRLLRLGSPLFHFGILGVFLGHVVGLVIPSSWTEFVGISGGVYHFLAVSLGAVSGAAALVGMITDLPPTHRGPGVQRHHAHGQGDVPARRLRLVPRDLLPTTQSGADGRGPAGVPSPWRGRVPALRTVAVHRLVHVFSAPVGYLRRPCVVYRSKDGRLGARAPRQGWEQIGGPQPRPSGTPRRR